VKNSPPVTAVEKSSSRSWVPSGTPMNIRRSISSVTAGLFAFFTAWNEFFIVLILLSDEPKYTMPVALTTLLTGTLGSIHWGILNASVVITALPCLVLYAVLQRHFVRGVMAGMGH